MIGQDFEEISLKIDQQMCIARDRLGIVCLIFECHGFRDEIDGPERSNDCHLDRFKRPSELEKVGGYSQCIVLALLGFTDTSARTKINKSDKPGEMITRSLYYRCESVLLSECYRKIVNVTTSNCWHLKKSSKVT